MQQFAKGMGLCSCVSCGCCDNEGVNRGLNFVLFFRGFDSEGVEVVRPYTPTTLDTDVGHFDLVVKVRHPFGILIFC